mmetsp:Transcript_27128/g.78992  ORF Transcript_27128/g.78992 Transcript_27128/m.78992 type:complete len:1005 (-) Transcript_27128:141-3155(-)
MPPKGKGKKGAKAKAAAAPAPEEDDWEAALAEFQDEKPAAPAAAEEPPAPPAEEPAAADPPAAASGSEPVDAAAAFLAKMGISENDGGEEKDTKKDKKKKKGKKPAAKKEEEPKQSAKGRMIAERLAKQREEEERLRKIQEEEEARLKEEERKREEEARLVEEEKQRKKEKARLKLEEKKKAGTYKTKAQKEKERRDKERLEVMMAAGLIDEDASAAAKEAGEKKKKPIYGRKKKTQQQQQEQVQSPSSATEGSEEADAGTPEPATPTEPAETAPAPAAEPAAAAEEEEDGGAEDWEDLAEDWEMSDVPDLGLGDLPPVKSAAEEDNPDLDLAEQERMEEEKRMRERSLVLKKRDDELRAKREEQERLEALEAAEKSKSEREAERRKADSRRRREETFAEREKLRSTDRLRSPIICIMGHVDTGKTKLLDKIRRTNVQDGEAGGITQQIGATFFPGETLEEKTGKLNGLVGMDLRVPGMLVIDTPGHEAFSNLRSRGSSLCDIAILVVDLMHGLEQQTIESIEMLRKKKCPFVVALNKIDRCYGWKTMPDLEIRDALEAQDKATQDEFQDRMRGVRTQLMEKGLNAELYWENQELKSTVSLVPTSAISGEGVHDLLHMLVRLTQSHMAEKLAWSRNLQCTVLEVKVIDGLGCTVDVILVNGEMRNGDNIVVCTTDGPIVTQVRALLTPPPNRELRIKSQYVHHDHLEGAMGIKICAPNLENAIAGSGIYVLGPEDDVDDVKEEVMREFSSLATNLGTDPEGVFAQASTLGALEALLQFLRHECDPPIPVHAMAIGPIFKRDVMRAALMIEKKKPEFATILAFDVPVDPDARQHAEEVGVTIFTADIIYHLFDQFTAHRTRTLEEEKAKASDVAVFPCVLQPMKNSVFRQKDPIILGVEVLDGILKIGTPLCIPKNGFLQVGRVTSIESNHQQVERVKKGTQCAIEITNDSNPNMTFGRQFNHEHAFYSELSRTSIDALKKFFKDEMTNEDWRLVIKMKKVFSIL